MVAPISQFIWKGDIEYQVNLVLNLSNGRQIRGSVIKEDILKFIEKVLDKRMWGCYFLTWSRFYKEGIDRFSFIYSFLYLW